MTGIKFEMLVMSLIVGEKHYRVLNFHFCRHYYMLLLVIAAAFGSMLGDIGVILPDIVGFKNNNSRNYLLQKTKLLKQM